MPLFRFLRILGAVFHGETFTPIIAKNRANFVAPARTMGHFFEPHPR